MFEDYETGERTMNPLGLSVQKQWLDTHRFPRGARWGLHVIKLYLDGRKHGYKPTYPSEY